MSAARRVGRRLREARLAIQIANVVKVIGLADVRLMPRQFFDQGVELLAHNLINVHQFGVEIVEERGRGLAPDLAALEQSMLLCREKRNGRD